jgi:hypothetical protein
VIRIGIGTVGIGIGKGIGKAIGTEVDDPYYRIEAESGGYPPRSGGERNSSYQSNNNGVEKQSRLSSLSTHVDM